MTKDATEQTLHTDSFSSSLKLVGKFAGELGVRFLTVTYGKIENEEGKEQGERTNPNNNGEEQRRKNRPKQQGRKAVRKNRPK
jgi:hypothetical protein